MQNRVKMALDETRTLILGAQILLGFQFQAAFQDRFASLPPRAHTMAAVALVLMVLTIGLLIAPSSYHRLAAYGHDSRYFHRLVTQLSASALLPFTIAFGLDITVAVNHMLGDNGRAGEVIGTGVSAVAATAWYGTGMMIKRRCSVTTQKAADTPRPQSVTSSHAAPTLHARIEAMLTEARVILPGAQALLGFQLTIVLTATFETLPTASRMVHGGALLCVTLTIILLVMPAALHRMVWSGEDNPDFLHIGGAVTAMALVPLALGLMGDSYVVIARIAGPHTAVGTAACLACLMFGLWFAWPMMMRRSRNI